MFCIVESTFLCLIQEGPPLACKIPFAILDLLLIPLRFTQIGAGFSMHVCAAEIQASKNGKFDMGQNCDFQKSATIHAVKRRFASLNCVERRSTP